MSITCIDSDSPSGDMDRCTDLFVCWALVVVVAFIFGWSTIFGASALSIPFELLSSNGEDIVVSAAAVPSPLLVLPDLAFLVDTRRGNRVFGMDNVGFEPPFAFLAEADKSREPFFAILTSEFSADCGNAEADEGFSVVGAPSVPLTEALRLIDGMPMIYPSNSNSNEVPPAASTKP